MSEPLSRVILYKCKTLSPNYKDTYYFINRTAQATFFATLTHKDLTNSQVTRVSNNQIKVPFPVEEVRQYDYMKIENQRYNSTSQSTSYDIPFYCFIDRCEYVSNMCTLITFSVDVMQTFICDTSTVLPEAFVARCHSNSDTIFTNREPEPFTVGETSVDAQMEYSLGDLLVVVGVVAKTNVTISGTTIQTKGNEYLNGKSYAGATYFIFDIGDLTEMLALDDLIDSLPSPAAITDFYVVPKNSYIGAQTAWVVDPQVAGGSHRIINASTMTPAYNTAISGYTPKNNKLHNYPYCFLRAISPTGDYMDLKFEEFTDGTKFYERSNWYIEGSATLYPYKYSSPAVDNKSYAIRTGSLPHCSWYGDAYGQWKAQKMGSQLLSTAVDAGAGLIGTLVSAGIGMPVSAGIEFTRTITGLISNIGQNCADEIEAKNKINEFFNTKVSGDEALSQGQLSWFFQRVSVAKAEAEQIDNYFTMFGYAQNKIMNVRTYLNSSVRPKFNYIKTVGFSVQGEMENDYKNEINRIFDNGITFWKSTATIGDYSGNSLI